MRLRILLGTAAGLLVAGGWLLLHGLTAGEPYSRLSVWADAAGRLHLDYRACGDELVTDVVLFDGDPTGHAAALWQITSPASPAPPSPSGRPHPGSPARPRLAACPIPPARSPSS
jgi:hypothetical protein